MPQVTIYLDNETESMVRAAVRASGDSKSKWVADAVRARIRTEWPRSVVELAGALPDFPMVEEIRKSGREARRERL